MASTAVEYFVDAKARPKVLLPCRVPAGVSAPQSQRVADEVSAVIQVRCRVAVEADVADILSKPLPKKRQSFCYFENTRWGSKLVKGVEACSQPPGQKMFIIDFEETEKKWLLDSDTIRVAAAIKHDHPMGRN